MLKDAWPLDFLTFCLSHSQQYINTIPFVCTIFSATRLGLQMMITQVEIKHEQQLNECNLYSVSLQTVTVKWEKEGEEIKGPLSYNNFKMIIQSRTTNILIQTNLKY